MQQFRSPLSVAVTAVALTLIAVGVFGLVTGRAIASGPPFAAGSRWADHGSWQRGVANLSPELDGLMDVPASERFAHFRGVQVQLTDKNNKAVQLDITPGTVTSVSAASVSITGNDGGNHAFTLDDKTVRHHQAINQNDPVIVVALNGSTTATSVFAMHGDGLGTPSSASPGAAGAAVR